MLIQNFITSGDIELGDFLYSDKRTKGKLKSTAKLIKKQKLIIGRAISKIDKNLWAVLIENIKEN